MDLDSDFIKHEREISKKHNPEEMFDDILSRLQGIEDSMNRLQSEFSAMRNILGLGKIITLNSDATQCPECGEKHTDERIKAGLKCGPCAYGG